MPEFLTRLAFLSSGPAVVGLACTAALIVLVEDWRALLAALTAQYLLAGLLLTGAIQPEVVLLKIIVGGIICSILYLTARRIRSGAATRGLSRYPLPLGFHFRLLAIVLAGLTTYGLFERYSFPEAPAFLVFAAYWLAVMGCLTMIISQEALKAGLGLLTLETGFEILYAALERGLLIAGLLGIINILIALAIAYLASIQGLVEMGEEESRV